MHKVKGRIQPWGFGCRSHKRLLDHQESVDHRMGRKGLHETSQRRYLQRLQWRYASPKMSYDIYSINGLLLLYLFKFHLLMPGLAQDNLNFFSHKKTTQLDHQNLMPNFSSDSPGSYIAYVYFFCTFEYSIILPYFPNSILDRLTLLDGTEISKISPSSFKFFHTNTLLFPVTIHRLLQSSLVWSHLKSLIVLLVWMTVTNSRLHIP